MQDHHAWWSEGLMTMLLDLETFIMITEAQNIWFMFTFHPFFPLINKDA